MPRTAPQHLRTRPRSAVGRRNHQQRNNIENDLGSGVSLVPIQNTNRKRLLTELQSDATLNVNEQASKRHRLLVETTAAKSPRLTALASTSNTLLLHRNLCDNSSNLNPTPLVREP
ncbi:hypothetical protein BGZ70_004690, partial [Mortierella alpina]